MKVDIPDDIVIWFHRNDPGTYITVGMFMKIKGAIQRALDEKERTTHGSPTND